MNMNALNSLYAYFNSLEVLLISSICFLIICPYVLIVVVSSTNGIRSIFLNCGIQKSTILLNLQNKNTKNKTKKKNNRKVIILKKKNTIPSNPLKKKKKKYKFLLPPLTHL